jgi:hypothetical protein
MRISWLSAVLLVCASAAPLLAQASAQKPPKKGDAVIVRGCLRGSAIEDADLLTEDTEGDPKPNGSVPTLTYRLQGGKSVLKELKDKHDRKIVEVKGILRSELSRSGPGTTVGRTRITIGADPRNPTRGADQQMPVLEALSFEGTTTSCGK